MIQYRIKRFSEKITDKDREFLKNIDNKLKETYIKLNPTSVPEKDQPLEQQLKNQEIRFKRSENSGYIPSQKKKTPATGKSKRWIDKETHKLQDFKLKERWEQENKKHKIKITESQRKRLQELREKRKPKIQESESVLEKYLTKKNLKRGGITAAALGLTAGSIYGSKKYLEHREKEKLKKEYQEKFK